MAAEPEEVRIGACATRFAVDLYRALAGGDTNLVLSPSSIFSALAMTLAGAAGRTATQMADVLHVDTPDEELHAAAGRLIASMRPCWPRPSDRCTARRLVLSMPRLSLSSNIKLGDVLKKLGMADAFRSRTANFSAMSRDKLWIDAVHHQAWVDVDERGTTAAAATAVIMTKSGPPPRMVLDRPFLFMVHHRPTGTPLFLGRVLDPITGPATPAGTAATSSG